MQNVCVCKTFPGYNVFPLPKSIFATAIKKCGCVPQNSGLFRGGLCIFCQFYVGQILCFSVACCMQCLTRKVSQGQQARKTALVS